MKISDDILRISLSRRTAVERESQPHLAAATVTLKYIGGKHAHF